MALFKCKMCGGTLEIEGNETVAVCDYCGTKQTLPKLDDDRRANMYDRANHFRRNNEFDKAMGIYEQILNEDKSDAEAYWSLVLCRYGIEYVEDPATHKRVPTVNRTQFTSIFDDDNYKSAIFYADPYQKTVYEEEANKINEIQKGILTISQKEEPFDVFICYKETDNNGRRTPDSVLANELYHQLTQEGFKVFFSRITLEDKIGSAYEPYIFAALNSAKVMVVLGTKPEYFNAVWVKNEWSRYLSLVKQSEGKKVLIPAYRDMDPYDLPDEFSHLQAQDMSKLGFMQDLIRGIKKITQSDTPKTTIVKETITTSENANVVPLLKRAFLFLEDGDWDSANEYCEKVLDQDPENAQAYLGKLMAEIHVKTLDALKDCEQPFYDNNNYRKVIRFADKELKDTLRGYNEKATYTFAKKAMSLVNNEEEYIQVAHLFESISDYQDSAALTQSCYEKAEEARKDAILSTGKSKMTGKAISNYEAAIKLFESIPDWKDSNEQIYACQKKIEDIKDAILFEGKSKMTGEAISNYEAAIKLFKSIPDWKDSNEQIYACQKIIEKIKIKTKADRLEKERIAKRNKNIAIIITTSIVCAIIIFIILLNTVIIPNHKYNKAVALMDSGNVVEAYEAFIALDGFKDSADKANSVARSIKYNEAVALMDSGNVVEAYEAFIALDGFKDSADKAESIYKQYKIKVAKAGDYVFFGKYEQDDNTSNGKEDIEWLVLEAKDDKLFVISKYALDCKPYNTSFTDVTWETCTLRKWLNNDFINTAFSAEEKAMIPTVTVSADKNPYYSTNPGNETQDQVFLLSITEANKYFRSDSAKQCEPTDYAFSNGAMVHGNDNCWWWLRSPGDIQYNADIVIFDGYVAEYGFSVDTDGIAVRPALWINLNS